MSLLRLGLNPDGTRHTSDLGPNIGRCVARGGLPLSQALTSLTSWKRPDLKRRIPRAPLNRNPPRLRTRPRCGYLMPIAKEYCNRTPGHAQSHRSARIMAEDSDRRRTSGQKPGRNFVLEKCPQCDLTTNAPNLRRHLQGAAHR